MNYGIFKIKNLFMESEKTKNRQVELKIPTYAGKYCIGGECGFCIMISHKPSFIKRFFMNHLLGWKWYNI